MSHSAYVFAQALLNHEADASRLRQFHKLMSDLALKVSALDTHQARSLSRNLRQTLTVSQTPQKVYEKWLWYLVNYGDLRLLPDICTYLYDGILALEGKIQAIIEVPHHVSKKHEVSLVNLIQRKFQADIEYEFRLNPSLIGGFRVWCNGFLWDVSIKGWSHRILQEVG